MSILTPNHPLWEEFCTRLEGPEGCNFKGDYDEDGEVIPDTITWNCTGTIDKSKVILQAMPDIDVKATIAFSILMVDIAIAKFYLIAPHD